MTPLDEILARAGEIPPFPAVMRQAMALMADPAAGAGKLLDEVERDRALADRVIGMCDPTAPGGDVPAAALRDALARVGERRLLRVVLSAAGAGLLERELPGYDLARGELWAHSMLCAALAESLCDLVRYPYPERAFAAGLLHDVGKPAMAGSVAAAYDAIHEAAAAGNIPFPEAEARVLGVGHDEVGARLGELWRIDPEITDAIRCHHAPAGSACGSRLPFLVHLSDILCLGSGIGVGADGLQYKVDHDLCKAYGIGSREFGIATIRLTEAVAQQQGLAGTSERER